jgi:hypothetical protein
VRENQSLFVCNHSALPHESLSLERIVDSAQKGLALMTLASLTFCFLSGCDDPRNHPSARATRLYVSAVCNALASGVAADDIAGNVRQYVLTKDPDLAAQDVWDESTIVAGNHIAATTDCPHYFPSDSVWKRKDFFNLRPDGTYR